MVKQTVCGVALAAILGLSLCGCSSNDIKTESGMDRFQCIQGNANDWGDTIWVDTTTGVEYWRHYGYRRETMTVLLDHDGNPIIAEGWIVK